MAWVIDWVILTVVAVVLTGLFSLVHITGLGLLVSVAVALAYWTYFWGSTGQSPGYRVVGIRTVTLSGEPLGYTWAFLRGLAVTLSLCFCIVPAVVSLIMMAVTERHQVIHDLILGTAVVGA